MMILMIVASVHGFFWHFGVALKRYGAVYCDRNVKKIKRDTVVIAV
jgi:hypothetical protein